MVGGENLLIGGMENQYAFLYVWMLKIQALALMSFVSSAKCGFYLESSTKVASMSFIHLHVHSQYSFHDGASSLDKLLHKAVALEMPALALTDHNRLTGAIRFYEVDPIVRTG